MNRKVILGMLLSLPFAPVELGAQTTRITSPDGLTYADVSLNDGKLSY